MKHQRMFGKEGTLTVAMNGHVLAYADRFRADLVADTVPFNNRGVTVQITCFPHVRG
jgi:hypothetical protein